MKLSKYLVSILSLVLIAGCGPTTSNPTTNPTTSTPTTEPTSDPTTNPTTTTDPSTEPSTEAPIEWVDLETAVANTRKGYQLSAVGFNSNSRSLIEYNVDNLYGYTYNQIGYGIFEEDPGFIHMFDIKHVYEDDYARRHDMTVYGRYAYKSYFDDIVQSTVFDYIGDAYLDFVKADDGLYTLKDQSFGYRIKDFFQSNMVKYCTDYEFTITPDGYLEYLNCYEDVNGVPTLVVRYLFEHVEKKSDIEMYRQWKENGAIFNVGLGDYKNLYQPTRFSEPCSVYEGEEVELELVVTTSDVDNNLYAAQYSDRYGFLGIKIQGHGNEFEPLDTIKVKGTIYTKNLEITLKDVTITDLNKKSDHALVYDEEAVSTNYGGGVYAASLFLNNPPFFADSLYTTYAYFKTYEEKSSTKDTKITFVFPSFKDNTNTPLTIDLVIPMELDADVKEGIYNTLKNTFNYGSISPTELEVANVLVKYDPTSPYYVSFEAVENTIVRRKLSTKEKIEEYFGFEDFPLPVGTGSMGFKFGIFNTMNIETYFNIDDSNPVKGIFAQIDGVTNNSFVEYMTVINGLGFELIEKTKDIQNKVHHVFDNNEGVYISMSITFDEYSSSPDGFVEMWIYNNDKPVLPLLIEEKLSAVVGDYYDMELFERYANTYDSDYNVFQLTSYAGKDFSENPLVCYTINVDSTSATSDYAKQLIRNHGFKQYKENGQITSYTTRNSSHLLLVDPTGTYFVDLSVYHTSDYTYYGHDEFTYRMEVLIYEGTEPLKIKKYDDISVLTQIHGKLDPQYDYAANVTLPDGAVVEYWAKTEKYHVDYGYGGRDEVFIYLKNQADIDDVYEQLKTAILGAGYEQSFNSENRESYSVTKDGQFLFVAIMRESEKGYIRLMNDVLGISFME